jgi:hypothetical protein
MAMNRHVKTLGLVVLAASAGVAGTIALAEPKDEHAKMPEMKLPAGWTMEDMQACMMAGTPGREHQAMAKDAGVWKGKNKMWMGPDMPAVESESTSTVTMLMDGRFVKVDSDGMMPDMGPFKGLGLYGFDNVSKKFQGVWIDNWGTGIMTGEGEMSTDGTTMTWNYTYNCPVRKKPATLRQVERTTGAGTKLMEMFATDPKSGKEYKMVEIAFTRQ